MDVRVTLPLLDFVNLLKETLSKQTGLNVTAVEITSYNKPVIFVDETNMVKAREFAHRADN